jgi:hypothetical protein
LWSLFTHCESRFAEIKVARNESICC